MIGNLDKTMIFTISVKSLDTFLLTTLKLKDPGTLYTYSYTALAQDIVWA